VSESNVVHPYQRSNTSSQLQCEIDKPHGPQINSQTTLLFVGNAYLFIADREMPLTA
jgi:hypothetical protein